MQGIDHGYKFAVEVIIPLNHDRYKQYLYQFSLLELGLFTAMSIGNLSNQPLILLFTFIGILLSIVWLMVLEKVNADIKQVLDIIEEHEKKFTDQFIKIHETRAKYLPIRGLEKGCRSGKIMCSIPFLFALAHIGIAFSYSIIIF